VTRIDISYFNYERGGLQTTNDPGALDPSGYGYDCAGLVRVMAVDEQWPDILVLGEGERYELNGQEGARDAARAMREAGGPAYEPLFCSLPGEWGPFAPVIYIDPTRIVARRWYSHHAPDFADRNRNLLIASLPGRPNDDVFRLVTGHGDLFDNDARLAASKKLRRLAGPAVPCMVLMDWNSVPSGPWEDRELNDPQLWPDGTHWARASRIFWEHGPAQVGPHRPDTRALDYLIGYWQNGQRVGGIGFYDCAELAGNYSPTQVPTADG
jgi:hypothetical protein